MIYLHISRENSQSYNRYVETIKDLTEQQCAGKEALIGAQRALESLERRHSHLGERIVDCVRLLVDEKMKHCDSEARRREMAKLTRMLEFKMVYAYNITSILIYLWIYIYRKALIDIIQHYWQNVQMLEDV